MLRYQTNYQVVTVIAPLSLHPAIDIIIVAIHH
jgi:hypothetical protein